MAHGDLRAALLDIVECGAPEYARRATLLLEQHQAPEGASNAGVWSTEATLLIDAYLHDPYLTRASD